MIQITLNIKPMGAVRMTQRGKWKSDAAQKYLSYKQQIGYAARKAIENPNSNPVIIFANFYYPIPKSFSKDKKELARSGQLRPVVKPDIDNVAKGIMDALNGVAYKDDNQVVGLMTNKFYADEPMIIIKIQEVDAA